MAFTYGFYDSSNGDRKYNADQMGSMLDGIISDGVVPNWGNSFKPTLVNSGPTISIGSGRAWLDHTWSFNDNALNITLPAAHASLNRWDTIYIETNSDPAVRANSIGYISGTSASTPSKPTLTKNATQRRYPIAYVYRPSGTGNTILATNITNVVGTVDMPYAINLLGTLNTSPALNRINTFRGTNLGTSFTSAQKAAIANGSFENMFIGDYWVLGGNVWRIADMDYYLNTGKKAMTKHHLVMVPDANMTKAPWQAGQGALSTNGAYVGSTIFRSTLPSMDSRIAALFGAAYMATYFQQFSSSASDGIVNGYQQFEDCRVALMTERQVYGCPVNQSLTSSTANNKNLFEFDYRQFALFRLAPQFIPIRDEYWLRDLEVGASICGVGSFGDAADFPANYNLGVRPYFLLAGN